MKRLAVLGSTGSIGTQSLSVIRENRSLYSVSSISCGSNIELFRGQLAEFEPSFAVCAKKEDALRLSAEFPRIKFSWGMDGIVEAACMQEVDMVVNALSGMMGIRPTYEAVRAGKDIAFANKETLVAAGPLIMAEVKKQGVNFLPVDSEHSAIFQCIQGAAGNRPTKIILTASGGPFRGFTREQLKNVTKEMALAHPKWNMGPKISIDSATMMNKGLEIIEACMLFDFDQKDVIVHVHPESIVHSAVEFSDGALMAQLGIPDMKVPIAYALSWPKRLSNIAEPPNLFEVGSLNFEKPDEETFVCLCLARKAMELGAGYPAVLNAANEEAVAAFLKDKISFLQIGEMVESALEHHSPMQIDSIEDVFEIERKTREFLR